MEPGAACMGWQRGPALTDVPCASSSLCVNLSLGTTDRLEESQALCPGWGWGHTLRASELHSPQGRARSCVLPPTV